MKYEPVITGGAVVGMVMAFVAWAVSMGWIDWTPEQMGYFEAFVAALGALAVPVVGALVVRRYTHSREWLKDEGLIEPDE